MSSNRSSKLLVVLSAVVLLAGAVGTVAALNVEAPETAEVGSEVNATFTLNSTDLYEGGEFRDWTLRGHTDLQDVTWTVIGYDAADTEVNRTLYPRSTEHGENFSHPIDIDNDVAYVEIQIEGTVPDISNFTYEPRTRITVASFTRIRGNSQQPLRTVTLYPHTNMSQQARQAIESASEVVDGSSSQTAQDTLANAKSFYDGEQFEEAIDAAERAENLATDARNQSQLIQTVIYVLVALLVIGAIVGAIWWYRKNQRSSRL